MSIDPVFQIMLNVFSLIFVIVNLFVGAKIVSKYFAFKNTVYFFIGFAWIGIAFPWLPETFNLIFRLFNAPIDDNVLLILFATVNLIVIPIFVILWILAINKLTGLKQLYKQALLISTIILSAIFEAYILIFLAIDPTFVGTVSTERLYTVNWSLNMNLLLLVLLVLY